MKIVDKAKLLVAGLAVMAMGAAAVTPASAVGFICEDGTQVTSMTECSSGFTENANNENNLMDTIKNVINILIYIIGFIAVVVIIFGGFTYATSAGDAGKVKKAKDTIMYGVIGLVVAILAFAIVNFVLTSLFGN